MNKVSHGVLICSEQDQKNDVLLVIISTVLSLNVLVEVEALSKKHYTIQIRDL